MDKYFIKVEVYLRNPHMYHILLCYHPSKANQINSTIANALKIMSLLKKIVTLKVDSCIVNIDSNKSECDLNCCHYDY